MPFPNGHISSEVYFDIRRFHGSGAQSFHHLHILAVIDGTLTLMQTHTLSKGEVCSIYSPQPVPIVSDNSYFYHMVIPAYLVLDIVSNTYLFHENFVRFTPRKSRHICNLFQEYNSFSSGHGKTISLKKDAVLYDLFHVLADAHTSSAPVGNSQPLIANIMQYLDENPFKHNSQQTTADYFHITPQYLARLIKKNTGKTFRQYCSYLAEKKAKPYQHYTLLTETQIQKHLEDIFLFHDIKTHFSETLGIPASLFTDRNSVPTASSVLQDSLSKKAIPASESAHVIRVDPSPKNSREISGFWKKLINLGYASESWSLQVEDLIHLIQKEIGFSYGRICGIINLVSEYHIQDNVYYDYSSVFFLLDTMIHNHLMPFIELGNKTFRIQPTLREAINPEDFIDSPSYYQKLLEILPDFIRTCVNRYGQEQFDQWRFEISHNYLENDYETFTFAKYIHYFNKIYTLIRNFSAHCQIGGPGFNDWEDTDKSIQMLHAFQGSTIIPDFFTVYAYPMTFDEENLPVIDNDPDILFKRLKAYVKAVHSQFPDKQIWVTEFNSNLSSRNYINDMNYQAAFIAKTITQSIPLGIHSLGYYLLSDAPLRYSDSWDFLFGGWGLFSDKNLAKASYYSYLFFSLLGRNLVKAEENYIITSDSKNSYHLLFHNYCHLSKLYCGHNVPAQALSNPGQIFDFGSPKTYQLQLKVDTAGTYLIKEYCITHEQGNLFFEWANANYITPSRKYEIDDFRVLSTIAPKMRTIHVKSDSVISFDITIDNLEIRIFLVVPYDNAANNTEFHSTGENI